MTGSQMIGTACGAFIFPFMIRLCWGHFVEKFGPIGGWMAAMWIVGLCWVLNHGIGLIFQSGGAWIDMAWAAGLGLFAASAFSGDSVGKGLVQVVDAIIGGILGGAVLFILFQYAAPWQI